MPRGYRGLTVVVGAVSVAQVVAVSRPFSPSGLWAVMWWNLLISAAFLACCRALLRTCNFRSIWADGRFYLIGAVFCYSIWVPLMVILAGTEEFRLLSPQSSLWDISALTTSQGLSFLMFVGVLAVLRLFPYGHREQRPRSSARRRGVRTGTTAAERHSRRPDSRPPSLMGWGVIAIAAHAAFLAPFLQGGFATLRNGGSILDVSRAVTVFGGPIDILVSVFLSPEIMTLSTGMALFTAFDRRRRARVALAVAALFLGVGMVVALSTTRTERFAILLLCLTAILSQLETRKAMHRRLGLAAAAAALAVTFVIGTSGKVYSPGQADDPLQKFSLAMRGFDGLGPYDAYLTALGDPPNAAMLWNFPFSLVRPIPFIGKAVLGLSGEASETSPLFDWMRSHYPAIYDAGGGLAYMPQIEAYLTFGALGVVALGCVVGAALRRPRHGMLNIMLVVMSLAFARGSLGVLAALVLPYGIICYGLYGRNFGRDACLDEPCPEPARSDSSVTEVAVTAGGEPNWRRS